MANSVVPAGDQPSQFAFQYEKIRILGKGTFGTVWLVRKPGHRTKYVAKEVLFFDHSDKYAKTKAEMAVNEVRVLSRLSHPNIVRYNAAIHESDRMFIIMDYAGAGDMKRLIRKRKETGNGPFAEEDILCWFTQLLLALKYIHGCKLLHRDIKPANVFLSNQNQVKLGDFGLTKATTSSAPQAHTVCGTPLYYAPEICHNSPYSSKADIWAAGCILYELMTLEHPFVGDDKVELYRQIINGEFKQPDPKDIFSEGLKGVLYRTLTADPDRRFSAEQLLATPILAATLEQIRKGHIPPSPVPKPKKHATEPGLDGNENRKEERPVEQDNRVSSPLPLAPDHFGSPKRNATRGPSEEARLVPVTADSKLRIQMLAKELSKTKASPPATLENNTLFPPRGASGTLSRPPRATTPTLPKIAQRRPPAIPFSPGLFTDSESDDMVRTEENMSPQRVTPVAVLRDAQENPARMDRNQLDAWITRTFDDGVKRRRIRQLMSSVTPQSTVDEQCSAFDAILSELGSEVTPAIHMALMSIVFAE